MDSKVDHGARAVSPWLFSLIGILALLAHLAVSFRYSNWSWGFNPYFFFRPGLTWVTIGLGCVLCLPQVWVCLSRLYRPRPETGSAPRPQARRAGGVARPTHHVTDIIIAGIFAVLFWLLRMPYHFLGDGRLMIRLLDEGKWFHAGEFLDRLIHYGVLIVTGPLWAWDGALVYTVLSVVAGFVYVLAALRLGTIVRRRLFVTASLVTLGTVQLFLGYAESYSFATVAILGYVVLALEYLLGRRKFVWVGLALLMGVALHNALLFLIPSFLYLMLARREKDTARPPRRILPGAVFLALILIMVAVTSSYQKGNFMLLPLFSKADAQYALFSWRHLVDFLNQQILISPLAWIGMGVFIYAFWKDPALRKSRRFRFLLLASAFPILFNLVIKPDLGGSRDWDLWSMGSLAYVVTVVCWIASSLGKRVEFRFAAYAFVVVGFFHVLPWVGVNHSREFSLDRFSRMLDNNPLWASGRIASAQSELAHFYIEQNSYEKAVGLLAQATDLDPKTARYWDALGMAYMGLERFKEAETPIRRAIDLDPDDYSAYNNLGRVYQVSGRPSEAEAAFKRSIELNPGSGPPHFNLGRVYLAQGQIGMAIEEYKRATEAWPFLIDYWYHLALTLEKIGGREKEALEAWNQVLTLARSDPSQQNTLRAALEHIEVLKRPGGPPAGGTK
jgi:Flp pilus assembly protein TadD